ncbi:MAG: LysR family transcriptional regulator [Neptuniibacter sp.]|nr:LysR family transcriptional regulator [Neptuniibacter sp.]
MNLRSIDLNLLVVLQALLEECHVSKASVRLGMSQPAVSRALQRLRQTMDDPLLVRTGSGYDLSARAVEIKPQLMRVLHEVQEIMQPERFDPLHAEGTVKFTGLDLELTLLIPKVVQLLRKKAPNLKVEIVPQVSDHFALLEQGEVHFSLTGLVPEVVQDQYRRIEVARTRDVCLMDENNPLAKGKISLEQYVDASHGLVSITGKGPGKMDDVLKPMGYKRKVMLRLASFMSVVEFCQDSDLIFTAPEMMAEHLSKNSSLVIRPLPKEFELPEIVFYVYWHARYHHDPMCSWIRAELAELFS